MSSRHSGVGTPWWFWRLSRMLFSSRVFSISKHAYYLHLQLPKQHHRRRYTVLRFVTQAPFQNCNTTSMHSSRHFARLGMQGNKETTNTQRQKEGHIEQWVSDWLGSWTGKRPPLCVCVMYSWTERQGCYMQLNDEVEELLHTERVYGKEMDRGDRFS